MFLQKGLIINMNRGLYDGVTKDDEVLYTKWDQDCPPANPHSINDEFENGFQSGKWTEFDQNGNLTITPMIVGCKGISLVQTTAATQQVAGLYQPIPADSFTIMTKLSFSSPLAAGGNWAGLALWQDPTAATGDIYVYALNNPSASTALRFMVARYSQWNTYGADVQAEQDEWGFPTVYLRLRRTSTTYAIDISNGTGWLQVRSNTITFTPVAFGLFISNGNSGFIERANFHFFRYLPYDVGIGGDYLGNYINVYK